MSDWGIWGLHEAAERDYSLPAIWSDYKGWWGDNPDYPAQDSVKQWGNVEEYLQDRHGLDPYDEARFDHPATFAVSKLHSLAQSRPQIDGYIDTDHYLLTDDDLASGAALGLLKIRRNEQANRWEPEDIDPGHRYPPDHTARLAAVNQDLIDRLHDEFHDWYHNGGGIDQDEFWEDHLDPISSGQPARGPIGDWQNVERFLNSRYPAAHKGHGMGLEEAGHILDGHEPMPYQQNGRADLTPYETGSEAVGQYGYDPKEIAAGMLLLHNKSQPLRGDMLQRDQDRLNDIFDKRMKMQDAYRQRTKTAMPAPLPDDDEHHTARLAGYWDDEDFDGAPLGNAKPDLYLHPDEVMQYASPDNEYRNRDNLNSLIDDISQRGILTPVVINTNGTHAWLDDGHHRGLAAQALGMDKVPVSVVFDRHAGDPDAAVGPGLAAWLAKQSENTAWGYKDRGLIRQIFPDERGYYPLPDDDHHTAAANWRNSLDDGLDPDELVTLYHRTNRSNANQIVRDQAWIPNSERGDYEAPIGSSRTDQHIYFALRPGGDRSYGPSVVSTQVPRRSIKRDETQFWGGPGSKNDPQWVRVHIDDLAGRPIRRERSRSAARTSSWPDPSQETIPAEPGYIYHATHDLNAQDIADSGQLDVHDPGYGTDQDSWPDGDVEPRSYWTHDPQIARSFYPEGGRPALLRAPSSTDFRQEGYTGDLYSTRPIPAERLEVYSGPGQWTPLTQHRRTSGMPWHEAAVGHSEHDYSLPAMWKDYQEWNGSDPGYPALDSVQRWGNVEEYLKDRHGLDPYDPQTFDHPATLAAAKLHSLAQSRPQVDGYSDTDNYWLTDDDLTTGAALGLLKIRRNEAGNFEPEPEDDDPDREFFAARIAMPWYHVSPAELADGTALVPGRGEGHHGLGPDPEYVYLTDSPENAEFWRNRLRAPHLYEVEPQGTPTTDGGWSMPGNPLHEWRTPGAKVVRRIAMPYYHTDQELSPGDKLKPAIELDPSLGKSKWKGALEDYADYDPSKVYFTWRDTDPGHDEYTDPNSVYGPHAYEVEPVGDIEDDPEKETHRSFHEDELHIPYGPGSLGYDDYMAPNAIVKRKIDAPQVAKDYAEQMRGKYGPDWSNRTAMPHHRDKGWVPLPDAPGRAVTAMTHKPFKPSSDPYYFDGYDYDPEGDYDDPMRKDLQNAWLVGEGHGRRKPFIQRGLDGEEPSPDMSETERWMVGVGKEFGNRIRNAPPTEYEIYRGMTVPQSTIDDWHKTRRMNLPLSSFSADSSLALDYAMPDPHRGSSPRENNPSVVLRLPPGSQAYNLSDDWEHVTHGNFDINDMRPMTPEEADEFGGWGGEGMPTLVDISHSPDYRQRQDPPAKIDS